MSFYCHIQDDVTSIIINPQHISQLSMDVRLKININNLFIIQNILILHFN